MEITLNRTWRVGELIDGGGFSEVFVAESPDGRPAVAKMVLKAPGADRELLFADLENVRNVVPILDHGEFEDKLVIIMPRADKSLRRHIESMPSTQMSAPDATAILTDIAIALVDIKGNVVHRDLKPENVLLLDGRWCLADFGISRYAEASTAPDTRKNMMSHWYAAPEQWRYERATGATDVYSFGVIAYELLSGARPFGGPEFREQHLNESPVPLSGISLALASLVEECLYKSVGARPTPENILARLARAGEAAPSDGLAQLQSADYANVIRLGEASRKASVRLSEVDRRNALADDARAALKRIGETLKNAIGGVAPSANFSKGLDIGWTVSLDRAELRLEPPATSINEWEPWKPPAFDVVLYSSISLITPSSRSGYRGRSHSLWYCDAQSQGNYQWYETAFMISPLVPTQSEIDPFALNPSAEAAKAIWNGMAEYQVAWPFTPVIFGELDQFISRWAGWLASASQGQLAHPQMMPERDPRGSWRDH